MKRLTAILILVTSAFWCVGQVSNNAIKNRVQLAPDQPWFSSSTHNASVEWDCINKKLTSTCLVYHNDQWFTIVPPETGTYYINIANQKCHNQQGVQIVVLEGDPCKVDSYQLRMCISYTDQSDMHVQIDSLIGGREYLVNIDGFLGDQCDFDIQFSTTKAGIPVQARNTKSVILKIAAQDTLISLQWHIPDSLIFKISEVSLYRKHEKEKASTRIYYSGLQRNALGETESVYSTTDTLSRRGHYMYSIYGHEVDGDMTMLAKEDFLFEPKERRSRVKFKTNIDFNTSKSEHVNIAVFDQATERQLFTTTRRTQKGKNKLVLDLSEYVHDGVLFYKIVISNKTFRQEHLYKARKPPK
ncbi:MAG TPA: hypothetical protein VEB86_05285 [Chryseosolibacter sp.]|nr:hypothetical protein [Chryseosolibacter sp.]